ncbi:MAG: Uncharacterised protein [Prochlorococcus marinus str. MIT 9215]|nr:MAG: Uncharacterised protein [Prochlorococcus marinus str. MIT 9215]
MRIDVLHISHGLLKRVRGLISTANWSGMNLTFARARAMLLLQVLKHPARECAERLKSCPAQFLLLPESWVLADQPIVLPIEALTVRALAGFFWH